MQATRYSQANGFEDVTIDDSLRPWPTEWPTDSKDWGEFQRAYIDRKGWDHVESITPPSSITRTTNECHDREMEAWLTGDENWPAIVKLCLGSSGDTQLAVVFSSRADFIAYWHQFVGPVRASQAEFLEEMHLIAFRDSEGRSANAQALATITGHLEDVDAEIGRIREVVVEVAELGSPHAQNLAAKIQTEIRNVVAEIRNVQDAVAEILSATDAGSAATLQG